MKKNGFTLIEILVTIALLAAISVTVGISMTGMLERQNAKKLKDYEDEIAKAGCVYAEINDNTTNTTVKINKLIKEGLIKKDLANPNNGKPLSEYGNRTVTIKWVNKERVCSYDAGSD